MTTKKTTKNRSAMPDPLTEQPQPDLVEKAQELPAEPTKIVVYNPIEAGLAAMKEKHGHVLVTPPVVTAETYEPIKAARKEMVTFRTTLEKVRKAEKEASLRYGQLVDSEARRIQAVATPIEAAYTEAIDTYEQAEQRRKDDILERITEIRGTGGQAIGKPVEVLREVLAALDSTDLATFEEFREQAATAQEAALRDVRTLLAQAEEAEQARQQQAKERAKAERIQAIRLKIGAFNAALTQAATCRTSATLQRLVDATAAITVDDSYQELQAEAAERKATTLAELRRQHAAKVQTETDVAELAELRRERAEREAREASAAAAAPKPTEAPAPTTELEPPRDLGQRFPGGTSAGFEFKQGGTIVTEIEPGSGILGPVKNANGRILHGEVVFRIPDTPLAAGSTIPVMKDAERPTDAEILAVLSEHYYAELRVVAGWLTTFDAQAALNQIAMEI